MSSKKKVYVLYSIVGEMAPKIFKSKATVKKYIDKQPNLNYYEFLSQKEAQQFIMKSNNKKTAKDIQKLNEVPEKANKAKNELDRNVISTKTKQIRDETNQWIKKRNEYMEEVKQKKKQRQKFFSQMFDSNFKNVRQKMIKQFRDFDSNQHNTGDQIEIKQYEKAVKIKQGNIQQNEHNNKPPQKQMSKQVQMPKLEQTLTFSSKSQQIKQKVYQQSKKIQITQKQTKNQDNLMQQSQSNLSKQIKQDKDIRLTQIVHDGQSQQQQKQKISQKQNQESKSKQQQLGRQHVEKPLNIISHDQIRKQQVSNIQNKNQEKKQSQSSTSSSSSSSQSQSDSIKENKKETNQQQVVGKSSILKQEQPQKIQKQTQIKNMVNSSVLQQLNQGSQNIILSQKQLKVSKEIQSSNEKQQKQLKPKYVYKVKFQEINYIKGTPNSQKVPQIIKQGNQIQSNQQKSQNNKQIKMENSNNSMMDVFDSQKIMQSKNQQINIQSNRIQVTSSIIEEQQNRQIKAQAGHQKGDQNKSLFNLSNQNVEGKHQQDLLQRKEDIVDQKSIMTQEQKNKSKVLEAAQQIRKLLGLHQGFGGQFIKLNYEFKQDTHTEQIDQDTRKRSIDDYIQKNRKQIPHKQIQKFQEQVKKLQKQQTQMTKTQRQQQTPTKRQVSQDSIQSHQLKIQNKSQILKQIAKSSSQIQFDRRVRQQNQLVTGAKNTQNSYKQNDNIEKSINSKHLQQLQISKAIKQNLVRKQEQQTQQSGVKFMDVQTIEQRREQLINQKIQRHHQVSKAQQDDKQMIGTNSQSHQSEQKRKWQNQAQENRQEYLQLSLNQNIDSNSFQQQIRSLKSRWYRSMPIQIQQINRSQLNCTNYPVMYKVYISATKNQNPGFTKAKYQIFTQHNNPQETQQNMANKLTEKSRVLNNQKLVYQRQFKLGITRNSQSILAATAATLTDIILSHKYLGGNPHIFNINVPKQLVSRSQDSLDDRIANVSRFVQKISRKGFTQV